MESRRHPLFPVAIGMLVVALALACSRPAPAPGGTAAKGPAAGVVEMRPTLPAPAPGASVAPPTAQIFPPGPAAPATPRYFNLLALPVTAMPSDFSIGPLVDLVNPKDGDAAIVTAFSAVLDGLVTGQLPESAILPGRLPILRSLMDQDFERHAPRSWRLGTVVAGLDSAVAPIGLFGPGDGGGGNLELPPRADGEIRARFRDGTWYVEDVSFSSEALGRPRPLPTAPFDPPVTFATMTPKDR